MNSASDENIVGKLTVQTKEEMQDMMKSDSVIEIVELILKNLVPKFGNNKMKHDPHQIMSKLRIQNNGSFKKSHAPNKDVRRALKFLKEDVGTQKMTLRFIENLECTSSDRKPTKKF